MAAKCHKECGALQGDEMKLTGLIAVILVVAHLAVPQQYFTYGPCCYDAHGRLLSKCCGAPVAKVVIHGESCCDPRVTTLRDAPPAPGLTPLYSNTTDDQNPLVLPAVPALSTFETLAANDGKRTLRTTGPPCADLLAAHSRLNL